MTGSFGRRRKKSGWAKIWAEKQCVGKKVTGKNR
jgi:hypothetical protein